MQLSVSIGSNTPIPSHLLSKKDSQSIREDFHWPENKERISVSVQREISPENVLVALENTHFIIIPKRYIERAKKPS